MTGDYLFSGLKMVGVLILMIAAMGGLHLYARRMLKQGLTISGRRRLRVLESIFLGPKKSIALVEVPGGALVVGVTGDRISLLDKIPADRMPEEPEGGSSLPGHGQTGRFHRVLGRLMGTHTGGDGEGRE